MKLPLLIRNVACIIIVTISSFTLSCEGRAKIVGSKSINIDMRLDVKGYASSYSSNINGWLYIDNYNKDKLTSTIDLEECGFLYRKKGRPESDNKEFSTSCKGYMTQIDFDCDYYKEGEYLILTPFVCSDDHDYFGQPIQVRLN